MGPSATPYFGIWAEEVQRASFPQSLRILFCFLLQPFLISEVKLEIVIIVLTLVFPSCVFIGE